MVRTFVTVACVTVMVMAVGLPAFQGGGSGGAPAHVVDQAQMDRWKKELSNWGRWGADDQLGALNLITPAKRKQAAALVREGFPVSLARDDVPEKAPEKARKGRPRKGPTQPMRTRPGTRRQRATGPGASSIRPPCSTCSPHG